MGAYSLKTENVTRLFGRRLIFKNINFCFSENGIYGISGPNGAGKSTFVKIIAGIISPSSGKVLHLSGGVPVPSEKLHEHIGFVAPYLILYDEFSAMENIERAANIRGIAHDSEKAEMLFEKMNLFKRKDDPVKGYSSGMKQRLKYIFALMHSPELLIFDEPTSNLDSAGKEIVYNIMKEEAESRIVIAASNEENDLALCGEIINLQDFKLRK
jgi:heme exporter protein A